MSKQPRIIPAVIASNQDEFDASLRKVMSFAPIIQLDVMDGVFVPSRSLDFDLRLPEGPHYQAHLMVADVQRYVKRFRSSAGTLIIHAESLRDVEADVEKLKTHGVSLFLALNPETPVERIEPVIGRLDGVMVMTVNPGKYGSRFLPECLDKVEELKALRRSLTVEVDGGMVPETVRLARRKGVDLFTSGSYIMKSPDPLGAYRELEEAAQG
ncbi:MAG: ribulose-phosphate 3-epimerase [Candidatus Bathyarchaeota archaeon]